MITLLYRCRKCGRSFEVKRSTAMNKKRLWDNLCKIKDNEVKTHFDKYHQSDEYITVFPETVNHTDCLKALDIHEKLGVSIVYGLFFHKMSDGSIGFVH